MDIDLPYRAEYAKSGRAKCKICKTSIAAGVLRLATLVQSPFFDGKQANWSHFECFFQKQRPKSEGDFENFGNLRPDDQDKIKSKIGQNGSDVLPSSSKGKKRKESAASSSSNSQDFGIEYAKSGRATCCGCQLKILKDEIRVKKTVFDTEIGMKYGGQALWHHVECFSQCRNDLGWFETGEKLPGFKSLSKDDQENVKKVIKVMKAEDISSAVKKPKLEPKDEEDKKLEEKIKKQSKELFKFRDLIEKKMKRNHIKELLEYNNQTPRQDKNELLDMASDMLTFGALLPCDKCPNGQFLFKGSGYLCKGRLDWSKCANIVTTPPREKCKIPPELIEEYSFLNSYKPKVSNRVIKYIPPSVETIRSQLKTKDEVDGPKVKREKPPLYNFPIAIIGIENDDDIKKKITKLGGKVVTRINEQTVLVVSTPEAVKNMKSRMKTAKEYGVHVVSVDYLDVVKENPSEAVSYIVSKSICDWGVNPNNRLPAEEAVTKSKSIYTKSVPKSQKLKLKGGLAVDPNSGLEDIAHVYVSGKKKYSVVLGLADVQSKKNSYYKLQVLESDKKNKYWLFRSWGRIGTIIGGDKLDKFDNLIEAINSFEHHYEEKSGNPFALHDNFVKVPGKMYPIDIDYGDSEKVDVFKDNNIESKLSKPVQDLIKLIFDIDAMKKVMLEFDLDMEKMPLGKLSQKQIQSAYKVLTKISELIQKGGSRSEFIDCTNQFYTLIPHNFGIDNPPILDTAEQIKHHSEMLDSLMEIECAYSMLNAQSDDIKSDINPIDHHYEQLKTDIKPLDKSSDEFELLSKYVQNTHAETHRNYDLEIVDIFKVTRKGELRRYKPFKKLHNRKLLWHGSRLTNYAGILSHGLKIAPPEAPVTGYMFGKGIYFADMVSKSANYCATSKQNSTGLLLLSEVALGNMVEYTDAKYVTQLPKDKHSVKGVGKTCPDPKESHVRKDGVELPIGKPITDDKIKSSLLYNEYIVYDVAQVNLQYLLRTNFKYKY